MSVNIITIFFLKFNYYIIVFISVHFLLYLIILAASTYFNSANNDAPIVPSGILTPKLSVTVAPITAKVS